VGIGLASSLSPMYIAEVAPAQIRGRLVSINQLTIVIGILAAQITNWQIAEAVPTADQVRLLLSPPSAISSAAGEDGFDVDKERAAGLAIADQSGLAAVKQAFPKIGFLRPVTDDEKKAKAEEDARIMTAYVLPTWNGQYGWRWMFSAGTLPAAMFFLLMFFVPESPRWLVKNAQDEPARGILARIGGSSYADSAIADIRQTVVNEIERVNFRDLLEPKITRILMLGVVLAVFQQWCGINVIFNYAQDVFRAAGYGVSEMLLQIVITGTVNLILTFVAIYTVDRWGRRVLMLAGASSLAVVYTLMAACFFLQSTGPHVVLLVLLAIGCYACTLAPITWVVLSEIFPNRIRGAAMSVSVFALWIGCLTLTFSFPQLQRGLGPAGTFWLYSGICVLGFLFILRRLPETKGKTLEQIERELVD
jgi:MFS family permease